MNDLTFDGGMISQTTNKMWAAELLGEHRGFFETRDEAIESSLNHMHSLVEDWPADNLIVGRESMGEALVLTGDLVDIMEEASYNDTLGIKGIREKLDELHDTLTRMHEYEGG